MTNEQALQALAQVLNVLHEKGTFTVTPKDFAVLQQMHKTLQEAVSPPKSEETTKKK